MKAAVGFRNGLGNLIMLTPAIRALVEMTGDQVDLVLDEEWRGESNIAVRNIASWTKLIGEVIDFPLGYKADSYDIKYMSRHGNRDSVYMEFNKMKLEDDFDNVADWARSYQHEVEFYVNELKRDYGYTGPIYPQEMPVVPFPKKIGFAPQSQKRLLTIANGWLRTEGGGYARKEYPRWNELLGIILEWYEDLVIVLVGGDDDKAWADGLIDKLGDPRILNAVGDTEICQTGAIVKRSDAIICNDSCVLHMADALMRPGIALFGSTLVSKNGPYNKTMKVIRSPLECSPCQYHVQWKTCENQICMDEIEPSLVFATLRRIL